MRGWKLLYSPNLEVLEEEFLRRASSGDRFRAIVPTRAWAERLDRELLKRGVRGLCDSPVRTFRLTVDWALRRAGERDTRTVADEPTRLLLMKVAVSKVYGKGGRRRFSPLAPFAGFISEMASISSMLKDARLKAEMLSEAGEELRKGNLSEVGEILAEYNRLLQRMEAEEEGDAYERLLKVPPSQIPEMGTLFVLGFHDLTELQFAVVEHLSQRAKETIFLFPFDSSREDLFEFARPTFERLSAECDEVRPLEWNFEGGRALDRLRRSFLGEAERGAPDDSIVLIEASGAAQEVEAVAREIRRLRHRSPSTSWSDFAVVYRLTEPYLPLIEELFPRYSIPFNASEGVSLYATGLGRAFCHLLLGRAQDFDRELILSALKSGYVTLVAGEEALNEIDVHLREQGVMRGREEWREGLERTIRRLEGEKREAEEMGDVERAKVLDKRKEEVEALRSDLSLLLDHLSCVRERATWPEMVESISSYVLPCLSPKYSALPSPQHLKRDIQAEEALDTLLQSLLLASKAAGDVEVGLAEAAGLIVHIVGRTRLSPSFVKGDAVSVLEVDASRGHRSRYAFVLGLLENSFPAEPMPDPFIPDGDREDLTRRYKVKMPRTMRRPREDDLFFFLCTQIPSERLYLCYPATDPEGKPNVVSRYVEEALSVLTRPQSREEDEGKVRRISLTVRDVVPRREGEASPSVEVSFCEEEAGTAALLLAHEAKEEEGALSWAATFLASDPKALDGLRIELKRRDFRGPSEWSGKVGFTPLVAQRWNAVFFEGISPTALETFGKCPFLYFVRHVLMAREIEEATLPISAKERGSLIHRILARFLQALKEEGALPLRKGEEEWAKGKLLEVAEEEFREREAQGRVGHPDVWKVERERVKQYLLKFVEGEAALQSKGLLPEHFEIKFGPRVKERPHPVVRLDKETEVPLQGVVDRIDCGPEGFRVIDYKTGSERKPQDLRSGKDFQLWAYVKAARLITGAEPVEAFYLMVTKPTKQRGASRSVVLDFSKDEVWELMEQVEEACRDYLLKIRDGFFPVLPSSPSECRNCPLKRVCRFDRLGRGGWR